MSSIKIGLRAPKTKNNPLGYEIVESIPKDEVCVLFLNGDGVTDDKSANGAAKIIEEQVLDTIDEKVPVYSTNYDFEGVHSEVSRLLDFAKHGHMQYSQIRNLSKAKAEDYDPQYVNDLFKRAILPRISLIDGKGKLSTEEACKRIRKLNIVAFCHGAHVALKLEEKMQTAMQELGYSKKEANLIQSQLLIIGRAPVCPLGVSKSQFISFHSAVDRKVPRGTNFFDDYIFKRNQEEMRRFYAEEINNEKGIKENRWFDFEPCYFPKQQGNFFLVKRKYDWDNPNDGPFNPVIDEHDDFSFYAPDETQDNQAITEDGRLIAKIAQTILRNGIKNSLQQKEEFIPLPPIEQLVLSDNTSTHDKEAQDFAKMSENGKKFMNDVYGYARQTKLNKQQIVK